MIAAASRTPFESQRRVFVIERVDELGDEAANRMLKTLEEPASFVHLILLTERLGEVLPTIRSRCQLVRFEPVSEDQVAAGIEELGVGAETALACVRLALQDAERARELASADGAALRASAERFARAALAGEIGVQRPWLEMLTAVRARGDAARAELESQAEAELELTARKERKRVEGEWGERAKRTRRRVQTGALDLALQLVALWFSDLACLRWDAPELVRNCDRSAELHEDPSRRVAGILSGCELRSSWSRTPGSALNSTSQRSWPARRSRTGWSRRSRREPPVTRVPAGTHPRGPG